MTETLFPRAPVPADERLAEIHRLLLEHFGRPKAREPWDPLSQFIYSLLSSRTRTETTYAVVAQLREGFGGWGERRVAPLGEWEQADETLTVRQEKAARRKADA